MRNTRCAECRKNTGSVERRENVGRTPEARKNAAQRVKMVKKNRENVGRTPRRESQSDMEIVRNIFHNLGLRLIGY